MGRLKIYKDNYTEATAVSNIFIDEYMKDANDAQLKIYLYLIRMMNANLPTSISDIADKFNHTEKDVLRALKYWEKQRLLTLEFDDSKSLIGIHLLDLNKSDSPAMDKPFTPVVTLMASPAVPETAVRPQTEADNPYAKPAYTLDQLKKFKSSEETSQLLFIVEQYIGRTPKDAEKYAYKYDKVVYGIMQALGKTSAPTKKEVEYINRWTRDFGYEMDVIDAACERTVLCTDKHRFEYADRILTSWYQANVHHKSDIARADELFRRNKAASQRPAASNTNKFNQFKQNHYDFDALEKELLRN